MNASSPLAVETERLLEDAIYSAKGHFEAARIWHTWHLGLGVAAAALAALAGGLASFSEYSKVAGAISLFVALVAGVATVLNAEKRSTAHLAAGNAFLGLRNEARFFRDIELAQSSDLSLRTEQLRKFSLRRDKLNSSSPPIPRFAFVRARRGIEEGEARHQVDPPHAPL